MARKRGKSPASAKETDETRLLVKHGFELARELRIRRVLVIAELITDRRLVEKHRRDESLIWVAHDRASLESLIEEKDHCVEMPKSPTGRMDQVTLALVIAILTGALKESETVLCLIGMAGSRRLDNLLIANPKRDFAWFARHSISRRKGLPDSQAFVRLIEIALKFAEEGREGKPVGTVFLLGDSDELERLARPLILNPCAGHPRKHRSIHDDDFVETMRELSALDGAFLVNPQGVVEGAGMYLDAPVTKSVKVRKGLGSRHLAAAAATVRSKCLAIAISESSGTVTVYSAGTEVMSLNRPVQHANIIK